MRVLGIDPGSHRIGYSILEKSRSKIDLLTYGTLDIPSKTPSPENLLLIQENLSHLLTEYQPELACVEYLFFNKNKKTAARVYESRGVILLTIASRGVQILEPTAPQIKKGVTGSGASEKKQVKEALQILLGIDSLVGHDDSWDAIAAAFVGIAIGKSGFQV